jgi:hypothetical protein
VRRCGKGRFMAEDRFDPYHRWLGIPLKEQPPNHYRLLGLALFEESGDVIESAADRQMAHVRTHQTGKHAADSQKLLNEIAVARLTLLDAEKKAAYDAELRQKPTPAKKAEPALRQATPLDEKPSKSGIGKGAGATQNSQAATPSKPAATESSPDVPMPKPAVNLAPVLLFAVIGGGTLLLLIALGIGALYFLGGSSEPAPPVAVVGVRPPPEIDPDPRTIDPPITPPNTDDPPVTDPPIQVEPPAQVEPPIQQDPPVTEDPADPIDPVDPPPTTEVADPAPPKRSPIAALFPTAAEDSRMPLPDAETRAAKAKQIAGLFPVDNARTYAEKLNLVQQLLRTARETENDAAAQYVLYDMARDVASTAGNVEVAFEAIEALDEQFQIDGAAVRAESLAKAAQAATPNNLKAQVIDEGIKVVDELFEKDRYVESAKLITMLTTLARKTRDKDQLAALGARQKQGSELFQGYKAAQAAIETLKKTPDDAAAAVIAGKYYTFTKGDWQRGLVMLSVSSDAALKKLAELEMAVPATAEEQKAVADAWLKQSGSAKGLEADRQKARAAMWYTKIQDGLSGLAKVEVQKQLQRIGEVKLDGGKPYVDLSPKIAAASTSGPLTGDPADESTIAQAPSGMSTTFVTGAEPTKLRPILYAADGGYAVATISGKPALSANGWYLYFKIDDDFLFDLPEDVAAKTVVVATILDRAPGSIAIQYDARDDIWKGTPHVKLTGSGKWMDVEIELPRARFANRQNGGADFRVSTHQTTAVVHKLVLRHVPGATTEPEYVRGKPVDLLALVDVSKNALNGAWRKENGNLISPEGQFTRIQIPYHPPEEYLLEVEATRMRGTSELCVGLVYQGAQCHVGFDRHHGTSTDLMVDMDSAVEGVAHYKGKVLEARQRHQIACTVRRNKLSASVNGKELLSYQGNRSWKGMNDFWTVPDPQALMVGAWGAEFQIHSIKLTPLSEGGDDAIARGAAPPDWQIGKAIDLIPLIDTAKDSVHGDWRIQRGELVVKGSPVARLQLPVIPPESYVLEVEATRTSGGIDLLVGLVYQGVQCAAALDGWGGSVTGWSHDRDFAHHSKRRQAFTNGQRSKITCTVSEAGMRVVQDRVEILKFEGKPDWTGHYPAWRIPDSRTLMIGAQSDYTIHSIKLTPLKELPALVRGAASTPAADMPTGKPIDLLALADTKKDAVLGDWRMDRGELLVPRINDGARMQFPGKVPQEYDLDLEVTRNGVGNELAIGLVYQGKQCTANIDRYSARATDIVADTGQGRNPVVAHSGEGDVLRNAVRSRVKCKVRKESITVEVNGREIVTYRGDATWTGINPGWAVPDKQALILGAWWADFRIHSFKLTPVGGASTASPRGVDDAAGVNVDLLRMVNLSEDITNGDWQMIGGKLISPAQPQAGLRIPYIPAREYDLEFEVALQQNSVDMELKLPYGGEILNFKIDSGREVKAGSTRRFRCEVRKTGINFYHNGKIATQSPRDPVAKPMRENTEPFFLLTQNTVAHVSSIRLVEIGGRGRPLRPRP